MTGMQMEREGGREAGRASLTVASSASRLTVACARGDV